MHDVGIVQIQENLRFTFEPLGNRGIAPNRQFFYDDMSFQGWVQRFVHGTHAAAGYQRNNFVLPDLVR
jgi:hypothetical protein